MLPKKDSWDVKYLRTIVLLDSEANHSYKHMRREAMRADIDHKKLLYNNIADHKAVLLPMESTVDCSLITNNISEKLSFERAVT